MRRIFKSFFLCILYFILVETGGDKVFDFKEHRLSAQEIVEEYAVMEDRYDVLTLEKDKIMAAPMTLLEFPVVLDDEHQFIQANVLGEGIEKNDPVRIDDRPKPVLDQGALAVLGFGLLGLLVIWRRIHKV